MSKELEFAVEFAKEVDEVLETGHPGVIAASEKLHGELVNILTQ